MKNIKKYIIRAILVFSPLILFFSAELILEVSDLYFTKPIRIASFWDDDLREHHMFTDRDFIPDPWFFWKIDPANKLTNSKGFLGPEFSENKPENTFRIFCLGDSNTMGSRDSSYPRELYRSFQTSPLYNAQFEVINAGVSGYTSLQGLRMCSEVMKYNPDLITICFGWNDSCLTDRRPDKYFQPVNRYLLNLERFLYRFRIYEFLKYGYYHLKYNHFNAQQSPPLQCRVNLSDYEANLLAMATLAKKNGSRVLFITRPFMLRLEPWMANFTEDAKIYNSAMRKAAAKIKVDLLDAEKIFSEHPEQFIDSCHFSEDGKELLAKEIYNYLKTNFVLDN
ncbi:SGNH/GDSL hydrolase family protein [Candidatus Omnitrophota bacterium]